MTSALSDVSLDQLFRKARTQNGWNDTPLAPRQLEALYDLLKFGPTSANTSPARFVFVCSVEGRERLAKHAFGPNAEKIRKAPCTAIIGHDLNFLDQMPQLFPHNPTMLDGLKGTPMLDSFMLRNSSLQGAYLMLAARALGLDCGPMSGFDQNGVDEAFFSDSSIRSNFICSLGHGNGEQIFPRLPRLTFDDACKVV